MPKNLIELSDKNQALLEKINFQPEVDNPLNLCSRKAYAATGLFSTEQIDKIFEGGTEEKKQRMRSIAQNVGMILIRPDMVHASKDFEQLISSRFEVEHSEDRIIDAETYWDIYQHDLYRLETMHSRLTRAAIYIGSSCRLIVYREKRSALSPIADFVHENIKGNQGFYEPGTLRGDVVFRNALSLNFHKIEHEHTDPRIKIATDPFGAYRNLVRNAPDKHPPGLVFPILFYNGVGVHVPTYQEMTTDLPSLLRAKQVDEFAD